MSEEINNELQSHKTDRKLTLRDTDFMSMMQRRIFNVLIVANPYDAFMLEDDGRIDEKVFEEYSKLGLRFPPRFFRAASHDDAVSLLGEHVFDLIICMPSTESNDVFQIVQRHAAKHILAAAHNDSFPIQRQIGIRICDI